MPKINRTKVAGPTLVNRGGAGLHTKMSEEQLQEQGIASAEEADELPKLEGIKARRHIPPSLKALEVPINSLTPDPNNARLHPEKNIEAIKDSLRMYGQRKPVSVAIRDDQRIVTAGNGTLEAAKALGWKTIAAAVDDDLTDVEAVGYGIADNRSAEWATWDFETLKALDKLLALQNHPMIGWTKGHLVAMRKEDYVELPESPGSSDGQDEDTEGATSQWLVLVECESEEHRQEVFDKLQGEGHVCQMLDK